MTSLGGSSKSSYLAAAGRRPAMRRRSASSSSEVSTTSSSSHSEEQFVLSAGNTPTTENPPALAAGLSASPAPILSPPSNTTTTTTPKDFQTPDSPAPTLHRSLPIAIELPGLRKLNAAPVYTPTEPLSARGDIPGAYFPHHEDPKSRVHRPHPFHPDARKNQPQSPRPVDRSESANRRRHRVPPSGLAMSEPSRLSSREPTSPTSLREHTPVASYMPSGAHDGPLPMGKYYPSNYEKRTSPTATQHYRPPPAGARPLHTKSEPQPSTHRMDSSHARMDSGAKHRLQQYQRDMIAQAALAASEVMGGTAARDGSGLPASAAALAGLPLANIQLTGSMMRGHKPVSPRLLPLGSPGPVTPIDLEGGGESYWTRGEAVSGLDAGRDQKDVNLTVRVEEDRRLRGAVTPPVPSH